MSAILRTPSQSTTGFVLILPDNWFKLILMTFISCILLTQSVSAATKRCFVCHSRGPMGDCKDPFYQNSTLVRQVTDIEERPCPSGWCGKSVQTKESEAILQTLRFCLQRPPSDGVERCALTMLGEHGGQERFMCFCKGDLCNGAIRVPTSSISIVFAIVVSIVWYRLL